MATSNTLAPYLKEVYPNGIAQVVPASTPFLNLTEFNQEMSDGKQAVLPIQLTHESGFTFGRGELALLGAVAHVAQDAVVDGYGVYLQIRITLEAIKKASSDKKAFAKWNSQKLIPAIESFRKRQETFCMAGGVGLGVVSANAAGALTISPASWAPGYWAGSEGTVLQAYTTTTGGVQHDGDLVITNVDLNNRVITVSGSTAATVAGDILFYKGARGNEPLGIFAIAQNTGVMFGIDASVYSLWKGNAYDCGTTILTLGKILQAAAIAAAKGADDSLVCLVPASAYANLNAAETSLVQHNEASTDKGKTSNGFSTLKFYSSTGSIEIAPSIYVPQGKAIIFSKEHTYRCGASDVATVSEGNDGMFDVAGFNTKEMRMASFETCFSERPGWMVVLTRSDGGVL
jgi:hypothetical protein